MSAAELERRMERLRAANLEPIHLVMSNATWAELVADPDCETMEVEGPEHRFTFNGVPVERVGDDAIGVSIVYQGVDRHRA